MLALGNTYHGITLYSIFVLKKSEREGVVNYNELNPSTSPRACATLDALVLTGSGSLDAGQLADNMRVSRGFAVGSLKLLDREGALKFTKNGKKKLYSIDKRGLVKFLGRVCAAVYKQETQRDSRLKGVTRAQVNAAARGLLKEFVASYEVIMGIREFRDMLFFIGVASDRGLDYATASVLLEILAIYREDNFDWEKFTPEQKKAVGVVASCVMMADFTSMMARGSIDRYLKPDTGRMTRMFEAFAPKI